MRLHPIRPAIVVFWNDKSHSKPAMDTIYFKGWEGATHCPLALLFQRTEHHLQLNQKQRKEASRHGYVGEDMRHVVETMIVHHDNHQMPMCQ